MGSRKIPDPTGGTLPEGWEESKPKQPEKPEFQPVVSLPPEPRPQINVTPGVSVSGGIGIQLDSSPVAKPKAAPRSIKSLSTALQAMANIEKIMNDLGSDKDRRKVSSWFFGEYEGLIPIQHDTTGPA